MVDEQFLVLSALGPDRAGLVAEVTEYLTERGGNVEDSRMVILGAEFGVMILVSGTADALERMERDRAQLEARTGMAVLLRRTRDPAAHRSAACLPCMLTAETLDREGIVHSIAAVLHKLDVNIVSVETSAYAAPVSGSLLFRMEATVDVPRALTLAKLRDALEEIAHSENIDIVVRPLG